MAYTKVFDPDEARNETLATQISRGLSGIVGLVGYILSGSFMQASAQYEPAVRDMSYQANKTLPNNLPSVSDLVTAELREAFVQPDRNEQLNPGPSSFYYETMLKLGYDTFWADTYWAAHWQLPSYSEGLQMLYRLRSGAVPDNLVFTVDDLKKLMRKLDIMPVYHDRLIEISYEPYTRVDIRRMYRLGVLTRDEVKSAYMDLGYNEARAEKLTQFTVADVDESEKAVTKSDVVNAYYDDIISADEFLAWVQKQNYEPDDEQLFLQIVNARKESQNTTKKERDLTRSDLEKAYVEDIISESDFVEMLEQRGYSTKEIEVIVALSRKKIEKSARKHP